MVSVYVAIIDELGNEGEVGPVVFAAVPVVGDYLNFDHDGYDYDLVVVGRTLFSTKGRSRWLEVRCQEVLT